MPYRDNPSRAEKIDGGGLSNFNGTTVLGDFNNWQYDLSYLMKKDPVSDRFWLTIDGLNPNQEYRYQYSIDDQYLRVADVYSEKILDKYNDQYIPLGNYPDLIDYPIPANDDGVKSVQFILDNFKKVLVNNDDSSSDGSETVSYTHLTLPTSDLV